MARPSNAAVEAQDGTVEPTPITRKPRKPSIPFTYQEATAYADMVKALTDNIVGVQQDKQGQWAVAVETHIVRVKRLTTLNAVMKYTAKARQVKLTPEDVPATVEP